VPWNGLEPVSITWVSATECVPPRWNGHDITCNVVAQVTGSAKTPGFAQGPIGIGHGNRRDILSWVTNASVRIDPLGRDIPFTHQWRPHGVSPVVSHSVHGVAGGEYTRRTPPPDRLSVAISVSRASPVRTKQDRSAPVRSVGGVAATIEGKFYRVLRKGFGKSASAAAPTPKRVYPSNPATG